MSPTAIPGNLILQSPTANDPLLDLNTQPSLDLQFATSKTLDDAVSGTNLITFSRASSGTYVDSDGLIKTAVTDAPRFDHDPVTGESLGLLIEEERTNLLRYSEQFDQSAWSKTSGITLSSNVETAPDGNLTADGLTRTATNEFMYSASSVTGTLTLSCWVKVASGTATFFMQSFSGADGGQTSPTKTATTEWQRFELTVSTTVPSNFYPCLGAINTTFYIWGAQLETGSFPTSYIPTTSSAVTRSPDIATIEGTNFSSWYNQSEGTVYITYQNRNVSTPFSAAKFNDGTGLNIITPVNNSNNATIITAGVIVFSETTSANVYLQTLKRALAFEENNTRLAANGTLVGAVDTSVTIPVVNKVDIGTGTAGAIARLAYYPYRLADATLQEITS